MQDRVATQCTRVRLPKGMGIVLAAWIVVFLMFGAGNLPQAANEASIGHRNSSAKISYSLI